jgi:hypothetical protein
MNYSLFLFNMVVDHKEPIALTLRWNVIGYAEHLYSLRQNQVVHTIHDVL